MMQTEMHAYTGLMMYLINQLITSDCHIQAIYCDNTNGINNEMI